MEGTLVSVAKCAAAPFIAYLIGSRKVRSWEARKSIGAEEIVRVRAPTRDTWADLT